MSISPQRAREAKSLSRLFLLRGCQLLITSSVEEWASIVVDIYDEIHGRVTPGVRAGGQTDKPKTVLCFRDPSVLMYRMKYQLSSAAVASGA